MSPEEIAEAMMQDEGFCPNTENTIIDRVRRANALCLKIDGMPLSRHAIAAIIVSVATFMPSTEDR
jgi:hypothetical protein